MFFKPINLSFLFLTTTTIFFQKIASKPLENRETCVNNTNCQAKNFLEKLNDGLSPKELCRFCEISVGVIRSLIDKNDTASFSKIATIFCDVFKIEDPTVCDYVIKAYQVII